MARNQSKNPAGSGLTILPAAETWIIQCSSLAISTCVAPFRPRPRYIRSRVRRFFYVTRNWYERQVFTQWKVRFDYTSIKCSFAIRERDDAKKQNATLLAASKSIIDYAENESFNLAKLKDSPEAETYAAKACAAVGAAQTIITAAEKQPPETCPSHEPV